jgi:hypothetical protein
LYLGLIPKHEITLVLRGLRILKRSENLELSTQDCPKAQDQGTRMPHQVNFATRWYILSQLEAVVLARHQNLVIIT